MSLTQDEYILVNTGKSASAGEPKTIQINSSDPFLKEDLGIIIHTFEKDTQNWIDEDYAKAYTYRDVYSTKDFSGRVREQMDYYPGMHQTASPPLKDPLYTNASEKADERMDFWNNAMDTPGAFMNGLESRQGDIDYSKIFGHQKSNKDRAENIGRMITKCVPCFDRLLDMDGLLPDGDLLEVHLMNIKVRSDMLDKAAALFKDPGLYIDICSLLKLLSHLCPQDLMAMTALLTQYLAKLNLEVNFNLDFIIQLVGPLLSPFLDALSQWLDKWIQLLLNPMICVLDHINETILIAQQAKIPLMDVSANINTNANLAGPLHKNYSNDSNVGAGAGLGDPNAFLFEDGRNPHIGAWADEEAQAFNTPDDQKYNPDQPTVPAEETEMAYQEVADAWSPGFTEEERSERTKKWSELRAKHQSKIKEIPPPLKSYDHNGTRWSKDDIPNSEKYVSGNSWELGYHPPESQSTPKPATEYFVTSPLVNSVVEVRNIMQGGIQYVQDWFEYVTQMTYDLLGTDIGWMSKKNDRTVLKSKIIQVIYMLRAIAEAISKNGLECGTDTNYDRGQMEFMLEDTMNESLTGGRQFHVDDDGTIKLSTATIPSVKGNTSNTTDNKSSSIGASDDTITSETIEQSSVSIRDCFKSVSQEQISEVKKWIADFEKRS